jgi:hypothetical protein
MNVTIKSKSEFNLGCFFSKQVLLLFVSLFFIVSLFSSPFILEANGWRAFQDYAGDEAELIAAINTAPEDEYYAIVIWRDIVLEKPLEIPDGKFIVFGSNSRLVGGDGVDAIIVKSGGTLVLEGSLVVTHAEGDSGRGVYVEHGGAFVVLGGEITGNSATKGGGVYNEGTFTLWNDVDATRG